MINLGQSSETKYSLKGYLNKQETVAPIARDIAQAIQVADNTFKGFSEIQDKATQSRYFNAVTDFNNLRTQQQDELGVVGNDLNAQRQVLDKYKDSFNSLSTKYELDDKYSAQLGTSIESHVSGFEEKYRSLYNAQQKDIALSNIADVTSAMIGNAKVEDVVPTLQGLKEYYKSVSGADDRTSSIEVAKNFYNAKLTSFALSKENASYEQATLMRKELEASLVKFDSKITSDAGFRSAINTADALVEERRRLEEEKLKDVINAGTVPLKTVNTMLSDYRRRGIIGDEKTAYFAEVYKDKRQTEQLQDMARQEALSNDSAKRLNWKFDYTTKSMDEFRTEAYKEVKAGRLDPDQAEYEINKRQKELEKQLNTKSKSIDKENTGHLEANKTTKLTDGTIVTPEIYEKWKRNQTEDGALGADAQKAVEDYKIRYLADTKPEAFEEATALSFYNVDSAKAIAEENIDKQYNAYLRGEVKDLSKLVKFARNYGTNGNIGAHFNTMLQDPKAFSAAQDVITELKVASPTDYKNIVGDDNVARFELISMLTKRAKLDAPDKAVIELAEKTFKDPIDMYSDKWKETNKKVTEVLDSFNVVVDRDEFVKKAINLYKLGMNPSDIKSEIKAQVSYNRSDNPNIELTQYPVPVSVKSMEALESIHKFETDETNGAQVLIAYNPATKTIWRYLNGKTIGENTNQRTIEDYTRMMLKVMETKAKKEADIKARKIMDADYDKQLKEVRGY